MTPHFSAEELECKCGCGLLPSLFLAKKLEERRVAGGGMPIALSSAARCPGHNSNSEGSPRSLHMYGLAADVMRWGPYKATDPVGKVAIKKLFEAGGFYVLESEGCIHVDCRQWIPEVLKVREK